MSKFYILEEGSQPALPIKNWGPLAQHIQYEFDWYSTKRVQLPSTATALIMHSRGRLLDVLNGFHAGLGLVMSSRLLDILADYHLPAKEAYALNIVWRKQTYQNYQWVHIARLQDSPPPFSLIESKACIVDSNGIKSEPLAFTTIDDAMSVNARYELGRLVITPKTAEYDMVAFRGLPPGYLISERLYQRLVTERISGIKLYAAEWISVI